MANGRFVSKLAITGFLVAGASCFANENHFPRLCGSEPLKRNSQISMQHAAPLANPFVGAWGRSIETSSAVDSALNVGPEASTELMPISRKATSYYLIWSQGFLPKFTIMTAVLFSLNWTGVAGRMGMFLSQGWHTHLSAPLRSALGSSFPNLFLPLLSSSCCLLQLIINALVGAGGCAGFNTLLGPLRPLFLSLLAYLNWSVRPPLNQGILRLSLALLPEAVHLWNQWLVLHWQQRNNFKTNDTTAIWATVEVEIPTMGCVACVNKIDMSLRQSAPDKILDATSWLDPQKEKGGRARLQLALESREELNSMNELILRQIHDAGFPGSHVVHIHVQDNKRVS